MGLGPSRSKRFGSIRGVVTLGKISPSRAAYAVEKQHAINHTEMLIVLAFNMSSKAPLITSGTLGWPHEFVPIKARITANSGDDGQDPPRRAGRIHAP